MNEPNIGEHLALPVDRGWELRSKIVIGPRREAQRWMDGERSLVEGRGVAFVVEFALLFSDMWTAIDVVDFH